MNLLAQMQSIFGVQEQAIAKVTGKRSDGRLIATTLGGATVLLYGVTDVGKNVFYDRVSNKVLSEAPSVVFKEYGV